jgi:hypothetical protein
MTAFYREVYYEDWKEEKSNEKKKKFGGHWKNVLKDERKVRPA